MEVSFSIGLPLEIHPAISLGFPIINFRRNPTRPSFFKKNAGSSWDPEHLCVCVYMDAQDDIYMYNIYICIYI